MKSRTAYGLIATLIVALLAAGCGGGGGGGTSVAPPGVSGDKSLDIGNAVSPSTVTSPPGTVTPLTINGEDDGVPGGEVLTQGAPIFLLPNQLPVDITVPQTRAVSRAATLVPGHVYFRNGINVIDSGLMMSKNLVVGTAGGTFKRYALAYPASGETRTVELFVEGPIGVGLSTTKNLDVSGELDFTFELSNGGSLGAGLQSTYPSGSLYLLPGDSQSLLNAFFQVSLSALTVDAKVPSSLTFTWPGAVKSQTRSTRFLSASAGSTAIIYEAGSDPNNVAVVPSTGITSAALTLVK